MENRVKKFNDFTNESLNNSINESLKETVIKELESEGCNVEADAVKNHKISTNKNGADFMLMDSYKHKCEMSVCSAEKYGLNDSEGNDVDNDLIDRNLFYINIWADIDTLSIPVTKDQVEEMIKILQKTIK